MLLGPGARTEALAPHLAILGGSGALEALTDLAGALSGVPGAARLVVDADQLPIEDLGILRRFLAAGPERELYLLGDDSRNRAVRAFSGVQGARFLAWPPDLEQLAALASASRGTRRELGVPPPGPAGPTGPGGPGEPESTGELGTGDSLGAADPPPREAPYELPARRPAGRATGLAERDTGPAQRISGPLASAQLVDPLGEAATVDDAFDLGLVLEEVLAGVAVGGADTPRFLYRSRGDLAARGPRESLAQAFEALFRSVRELADAGSLIQVVAREEAADDQPPLAVVLNFPGGTLEPDDVLRVYQAEGRVEPDDSPLLAGLARRVTDLASLGAVVSFSSEARQRLLLELGFERHLAGMRPASSLAGA